MVAVHQADEHFRHDRSPHRSELFAAAALLRLLEDVVPERCVLVQAVLLCHGAVRSLCDLGGRERILDLHRFGDVLSRWQSQQYAALQIAERKAAAVPRQLVQLRNQERIQLPRRIARHIRGISGQHLMEAAPIDDPVAGKHRKRQRWLYRIGGQIAYNSARQTRKLEQQIERG